MAAMVKRDEDAQTKIVDRALAMAHEVGLEGLSLGALAAALKRSKSGLFAHFQSKEALQLAVLQEAIQRFGKLVIFPALAKPAGGPQLEALFDGYLAWVRGHDQNTGCIFMALAQEYDDRPGPVRDLLVDSQRKWRNTIKKVVQGAVQEGHLRSDLDVEQFSYEMLGTAMAFQQEHKLLANPQSEQKARAAFEGLLARSRRSSSVDHQTRKHS
jgi:AcrR family transcriptional regulator